MVTGPAGQRAKRFAMIFYSEQNQKHGFTVVELLIVIVVIAILAAISIVAYNGIQQRSNNTAIIEAASRTTRLIQAYVAAEGTYPLPTNATHFACITTESGCYDTTQERTANATFDTNIAKVGQPPRSIPMSGDDRFGIIATYWPGAAIASSGPFYISYYLQGVNQQCGVNGVLNAGVNGYVTTGYTAGNAGTGKTQCIIHIPGPAYSP